MLKYFLVVKMDCRDTKFLNLWSVIQKVIRKKSFNISSFHVRRHTREKKTLECTVCFTTLSADGHLTVHIWYQIDEKPFKCAKAYTDGSKLINHMSFRIGG